MTTIPGAAVPANAEPGRYFVVRTSGIVPAIIRFLTRSPYDHAGIIIPADETGQLRVIEAEPSGARIAYLDEYDPDTVLVTDEPLTDEQRQHIAKNATQFLGAPYGFVDILCLALMLTIHRAPRWLSHRAETERAMICSQLVAADGQYAGVDWLCGQSTPAAVTPGMLGARILTKAWMKQ